MRNLRANERCPIHGRLDCCGRESVAPRYQKAAPKYKRIAPGTKLFPDGHIERTPSALRTKKHILLSHGARCRACHQLFSDYAEVELAHDNSKGMSGWKRDDSDANVFLLHKITNRAQGSMSWEQYSESVKSAGKKFPCEG